MSLAKFPGSNREPSGGEIALYGASSGLLYNFFSFFLNWTGRGWGFCVLLLHRSFSTRSSGRHLTKRADKQTAFIVSCSWDFFRFNRESVTDFLTGWKGVHNEPFLVESPGFLSLFAKRQHAETCVSERKKEEKKKKKDEKPMVSGGGFVNPNRNLAGRDRPL